MRSRRHFVRFARSTRAGSNAYGDRAALGQDANLCAVAVQTGDLASRIRDVPDFRKPGILFKDITTLLKDGDGSKSAIDGLLQRIGSRKIDAVVGTESRGSISAAPCA